MRCQLQEAQSIVNVRLPSRVVRNISLASIINVSSVQMRGFFDEPSQNLVSSLHTAGAREI